MFTIDNFISLSVVLTGYEATVLKPKNDTQKVAEMYFNTLNKEVPADVLTNLFSTFSTITTNNTNPDDINKAVLTQILEDKTLGPVARNIIQMWYVGIWYSLNTNQVDYVITSTAYTNGLVWKAMYAHPMGFSEENFGYWSDAPQIPNTNS